MAQDERGHDDHGYEELAEPRIHQVRQAFVEDAAPETVSDCLEAADRVTALLATLPPTEARRFVAFLGEVLATVAIPSTSEN